MSAVHGGPAGSHGAEASASVRRLLQATRTLQDRLRLWALEKASEGDVSDAYVQIGNEFNATIAAFAEFDVDLTEVYAVPKELREILENCLGEDPSPQVLNTYMPEVRRVCYTLLEGLQSKQPVLQHAIMAAASGRGTPPSYLDARR